MTIVRFTLPRLIAYKEMERMGVPMGLSEEDWEVILDKMIYAFRCSDDEEFDSPHTQDEECGLMTSESDEKGYSELRTYGLYYDKEKAQIRADKTEEGMALFGKYFHGLWD